MKKAPKQMLGYSLLESSVVIAAMGVLVAIGVINTAASTQSAKSDGAMSMIMSQLRLARTEALADRRNVTVSFDTNAQQLNVQIISVGQEPVHPVQSFPLPAGAQFVLESGVPDTPENFGNNDAVYFGDNADGSTVMQFTPAGTFVDGNNNVLNGTVFLGVPGNAATARAVTIMGGGGNVQRFTWNGSQWQR
ncbi:MAG TPA: GspH/FimT family pseudopilin [Verrucomicrobiae bacterium]|nr:GspH/FimT family pseudopilin [Verrucomicrobiae bacterium]